MRAEKNEVQLDDCAVHFFDHFHSQCSERVSDGHSLRLLCPECWSAAPRPVAPPRQCRARGRPAAQRARRLLEARPLRPLSTADLQFRAAPRFEGAAYRCNKEAGQPLNLITLGAIKVKF